MHNEFGIKHYKGKWPCTAKTLYSEKTLIGRLQQYFLIYFETFSVPTADTLFLLILSILGRTQRFQLSEWTLLCESHVMPEFHSKDHVIIPCDSWDTKHNLLSIVDEYPNPDLIGNARSASVMYDLAYVHLFVCKISENILVKW